jgi:hypothetical protein
MIKMKLNLLAISVILAIGLSGCAPAVYTAKYLKKSEIKLAQDVKPAQAQGGITIELNPLSVDKEYEKPLFKQKIRVVYTPALSSTPVIEEKEFTIPIYNKAAAFNVTIINNTDHILRMKDARIVFIDPNNDEPILALDKQTVKDDINKLPTYQLTLNSLINSYPQTKTSVFEEDLNKAIINIVNQIKFINGFNMEIMPSMKVSGVLMFPIDPEKISDGKISFIDIVSKTDAAGNTTEKVRFDYKTKLAYSYWKKEPNTNTWVEISESDFTKFQTNPENYYYDKAQKKWLLGTPPKK